ncbi:MAG: four helix bundle protein [Sphingobacteriaceae bacterium]|nr:four helix bundle protein [Sphingobacteriaceae bacterium]
MATVTKIEDLLIWQEARVLVKGIFVLTNQEGFSKEFALKDQIKRSAISVMSNIAEGFGRGGNKEFVQFLYISSGSLSELKTQLYISFDFNLLSQEDLNKFLVNTFKLENMIKALIKKMKESEYTGTKYKTVSEL